MEIVKRCFLHAICMNKVMLTRYLLTIIFCLTTFISGHSQTLALRTNLLYDATLSPNLGAEMRIDSLWSVGLNIGLNAWDIDKQKHKKWRH